MTDQDPDVTPAAGHPDPRFPGPTAIGTQRRLRALAARAWSPVALQRETGIPTPLLDRASKNRGAISPHLAGAIKQAYDRLWDLDPPAATDQDRQAAAKAASRAASRGWAPPQAWDDDQIDLADAQPEHRWKPTGSTQKRAVDLVEDAEFVRSNDGYLQASVPEVAARLGVSPDRLSQAYSRARRYGARDAKVGNDHQAEAG